MTASGDSASGAVFLLSTDAFIAFLGAVASHIVGEKLSIDISTDLFNDLGLDSLKMLELLDTVACELADVEQSSLGALDVDVFERGTTVRDLYLHCLAVAQRPPGSAVLRT